MPTPIITLYIERTTKVVTDALTGGSPVVQIAPLRAHMPMIVVFHDNGTPVQIAEDGFPFTLRYVVKPTTGYAGAAYVYTSDCSQVGTGTSATYQLTPWIYSSILETALGNNSSVNFAAQITVDIAGNPQQFVSQPWTLTCLNSPARSTDTLPVDGAQTPRPIWVAGVGVAANFIAAGLYAVETLADAMASFSLEPDLDHAVPILILINAYVPGTDDLTVPAHYGPITIEGFGRQGCAALTLDPLTPLILSRCPIGSLTINGTGNVVANITLQDSPILGDASFTTSNGTVGADGTPGTAANDTFLNPGTDGSPGTAGHSLAVSILGNGTIGGDLHLTAGNGGNGGTGGAGGDSGPAIEPAAYGGNGGTAGDAGGLTLHLGPDIFVDGTLILTSRTPGTPGSAGAPGADLGGGGPTGSIPTAGGTGNVPAAVLDLQPLRTLGGLSLFNRHTHLPTAAPTGCMQIYNDNGVIKIINDAGGILILGALPPTSTPSTALIGGGAGALDAIVTAAGAVPTGNVANAVVSGVYSVWQLQSGTTAEDVTTGIVRPDDYNASTNARIWVQLV